jgi:hypothetical protein
VRERQICNFLVPLHDKSSTDQIVALAHFYMVGLGFLTQYELSSKGVEGKDEN